MSGVFILYMASTTIVKNLVIGVSLGSVRQRRHLARGAKLGITIRAEVLLFLKL